MQTLEEIYTQHWPLVYRFLYGLCQSQSLAEDLAQDTFYKAAKQIHRYDPQCKLSTWLCQIAKNTYYDHCRKQSTHNRLAPVETPDSPPGPGHKLEQKDQLLALLCSMQQLPMASREVVYLRVWGQMSFVEIGQVLGQTENWARVTFYRAKQALRKELPPDDT